MITSVGKPSAALPTNFNLNQNYPNPFNPTTTITYRLPAVSHVSLTIHDVLGREVATLVSARQAAGDYSVTFNGSNLPSGIYFYRIKAGSYTATKKLVLLK
ncbi:MAG: T9SS type A sorting domain-containing protein [Candidatus Kryptoniota bacterium]